MKTVSIVIENDSRLSILLEVINMMTYKNINEIVIINNDINNVINNDISPFPIKYIATKEEVNITATGDVIIFMDSSMYYIPTMIYNVVNQLETYNIITSNSITIHDIIINKTIKTTVQEYIVAFKKDYLINTNKAILNDNMIKIIDSSINNNDVKKIMIASASGMKIDNIIILEDHNIPNNMYEKYKQPHIIDTNYLDYDIVYFTGGHGIIWNPSDMSLGGSEQAVVNLSSNWVKLGKTVVVYGNFSKEYIIDGVHYKLWYQFPFEKKIKTLIVWRLPGTIQLMHIPCNADLLILDLHDNMNIFNSINKELLLKFMGSINIYNFKSNYHRKCFEEYFNIILNPSKVNIIMNGIRIEAFSTKPTQDIIRNPYRFCYCSCYTRGLEIILERIWPAIYKKEPRAEFHVYYGMHGIFDNDYKAKMIKLLNQPGVIDHDRQPLDVIVMEKYHSTFQLYLCVSDLEIDCISVRESLVAQCIPIITDFGVFKERHGLQYNTNDNIDGIICDILSKMYDNNFTEMARNTLSLSSTIIDWYDVAKLWLKSIDRPKKSKKIAIYNGLNIHNEMYGYFIDYFQKNNIIYDIFCYESNDSNAWKDFYQNLFNIKLSFIEPHNLRCYNYDKIILLTDDDCTFPDLFIEKIYSNIICIDHEATLRRSILMTHIGTRFFIKRPELEWIIPSYKIINIENKSNILSLQNKINIAIVGGLNIPPNEEILINLFDNFDDIEFHIICRNIIYKYTKPNIHTYENINTNNMIEICIKCNYILCLNLPSNQTQICDSMSGSIPLSFGTGCQLIIPSIWNEYYKFNSVITYTDKIIVKKETPLDSIYNELNQIISKRNNVLNNIFHSIS